MEGFHVVSAYQRFLSVARSNDDVGGQLRVSRDGERQLYGGTKKIPRRQSDPFIHFYGPSDSVILCRTRFPTGRFWAAR
ncbi:hypothetical protein HPP92_004256 [Vanilla planifolia]|uniref:Uncharacterized protein n=1 Tax=Vanilla planifolia TaxID=51239 RepID=A0A835RWZ8_VANPL|nr:hypothetical protein HPP92_004256 [Vanilla planifolia]